ncbi:MAG: hypothetical protein ACOZBL_00200 [Patescibacteria group bacterium]
MSFTKATNHGLFSFSKFLIFAFVDKNLKNFVLLSGLNETKTTIQSSGIVSNDSVIFSSNNLVLDSVNFKSQDVSLGNQYIITSFLFTNNHQEKIEFNISQPSKLSVLNSKTFSAQYFEMKDVFHLLISFNALNLSSQVNKKTLFFIYILTNKYNKYMFFYLIFNLFKNKKIPNTQDLILL